MREAPDRDASRRAGPFAFAGRARELDLLRAALRRPPAIVLVEGEAGIGKSRLVREATDALAEDVPTLTGYCHPLREPVPFGPVIDAFRRAGPLLPPVEAIPRTAGALAPLLPDLADRLPPAPARTGDARTDRHQLMQGVHAFLDALGPVVLVIEDVHWADEVTRELVVVLSRDIPEALSLVLTFRGVDLPPGTLLGSAFRRQPGTGGTTIHLDPLTERDVHELVVDALGHGADPALGRAVYERSEGLPLVVEEDLLTLREHPLPGRSAQIAQLERAAVPRALLEAFSERFEALTPAGRAAVEAAAVLAVPADEDVLAEVAGLDAADGRDGVSDAIRLAVLREQGPTSYTFRHSLAQVAAYQNIPGPQRHELHRRAVRVLEARPSPPLVQIAHHTLQSGDREGWLRRAEQAADQAVAVGDDGTAAGLLHRILDEPGLPEHARTRAALALAEIAVHGTDYAVNATVLRRLLGDPRLPAAARGEIRLSLGLLMVNHGGDRAGHQEVERAAEELSGRPDKAARAMIALAMDERDGAGAHAWEWIERAEKTLGDAPREAVRAAVEATRLTLRAREGDPGVWQALDLMPRQAGDFSVHRQTIRAVYNVGEIAIELGADVRARALLLEGRALLKGASFPQLDSYTRIALLRLRVLGGDWDDVDERFGGLAREFPDIAMAQVEQAMTTGRVAAARGRPARARELFATGAEIARTESQVTNALRAAAGLAAVHLAEGSPADAWATAAPAVAELRRADAWPRATGLVPVAVETALACGEREAAEALAEQVGRGVQGRDAAAATAECHAARGLLAGRSQAAAEHFARAREAWQEIGRPYDWALATERLGCALAAARTTDGAASKPSEALAHLEEACAVYQRLDAVCDSARCRKAMARLGLTRAHARGRRGYGDQLSPREEQVADFLARGATNREIAQALFLSPRTVELHVAHALKKLGTSRGDVAAALHASHDPH